MKVALVLCLLFLPALINGQLLSVNSAKGSELVLLKSEGNFNVYHFCVPMSTKPSHTVDFFAEAEFTFLPSANSLYAKVDYDYNGAGHDFFVIGSPRADLVVHLFKDGEALNGWSAEDLEDNIFSGQVTTDMILEKVTLRITAYSFQLTPKPSEAQCRAINTDFNHCNLKHCAICSPSGDTCLQCSESVPDVCGVCGGDGTSCQVPDYHSQNEPMHIYLPGLTILFPALLLCSFVCVLCCACCARHRNHKKKQEYTSLLVDDVTAPTAPQQVYYPQDIEMATGTQYPAVDYPEVSVPPQPYPPQVVFYPSFVPHYEQHAGLMPVLIPATQSGVQDYIASDYQLALKLQAEENAN